MASTVKSRKVVISKFGDASQLKIVTEDVAPPPKGHVQIAVLYAGFSGADVNMRLGRYPMQRAAPLTPGYCLAGRVAASGPGCSGGFKRGDLVAALTVYGAQAERVDVPERHLVPLAEGVSAEQAAALCVDWTTAYGMVARSARVAEGQRVFVHGLSGAVGQALMSLCQLRGAVVYGTASERNHAALRERGAHPYAYTSKDWIAAMQGLGGVHAVFDPLGYESFDESYSILSARERSVLVAYGANLVSLTGGRPRSMYPSLVKLLLRNLFFWSKKSTTFFYISREQKTFQPDMRTLMDMVKDNRVRVLIKRVWDMNDIKEAHQSWGKGPGMGSILVRVTPEE